MTASVSVNIVSWSLACTFWIAFIFPEVRGQEEVPSLSTEQRSETVGQDPEPPTVIDLSVESDSRTQRLRGPRVSRASSLSMAETSRLAQRWPLLLKRCERLLEGRLGEEIMNGNILS